MFEVRKTAKRVAEQSRLVQIDREALDAFTKELSSQEPHAPPWDRFHHFSGSQEETVSYLLVLDTLNFCFWPPPGRGRWEVDYGGRSYSGYYALAVSLKKAMEAGFPLEDSHYLASLSMDSLQKILHGRGTLQLMEQRLESIREMGRVLLESHHGRAQILVASAGRSAVALVRILSREISSFRDVATYGGGKVFFYKRAQILAADLHAALEGEGSGVFNDMEELTAFADYKVPQVLRQKGVLRYAKALAERVDHRVLLDPGGDEEVEIRANTIQAVELIRQGLRDRGQNLTAPEIDWLLWNLGQEDHFREKPYHRTITIFY